MTHPEATPSSKPPTTHVTVMTYLTSYPAWLRRDSTRGPALLNTNRPMSGECRMGCKTDVASSLIAMSFGIFF